MPARGLELATRPAWARYGVVRMAFEKEGLGGALQSVSDGSMALEYLSGKGVYSDRGEHPLPGVVLLDRNLPEIPGFDVLKWIRSHPSHSGLPVVIFTSSQRDEDRARAKVLGANEFLLKPHSWTGFAAVPRRLCREFLSKPQVGKGAPEIPVCCEPGGDTNRRGGLGTMSNKMPASEEPNRTNTGDQICEQCRLQPATREFPRRSREEHIQLGPLRLCASCFEKASSPKPK